MSLLEIKVPSPGESITEVEISSWLVKDGDWVEKEQTIAEVESDKATLEIVAEQTGKIQILIPEQEAVRVGEIIAVIDTTQVSASLASQESIVSEKTMVPKETHPEQKPIASTPLAKTILHQNGLDKQNISGSGHHGKILKQDAIKALAAMGRQDRKQTITKLSGLRRKLAQRLVSVKNETAMLTTFNEVDMSEIYRLRKLYKEEFSVKNGVGLGFMSFFTKAVTRALQLFPDVNAMIDGDQKISYHFCDISVAVSGPKGLMVPVIRDAETLSLKQIELKIKELATKVREGSISIEDITGGTFTITNGGTFGSMLSTPIINPPQSAILGMHNIIDRPIAVNGQVEIRPMMYLALSYDHRIIDGRESVGFLVAIKEAIENPVELLMDGNERNALEL